MRGDTLLGDRLRRAALGHQRAHGGDNIGAPAIVEGYAQRDPLIIERQIERRLCFAPQRRRDTLHTAEMPNLNALLVEIARLAIKELAEDTHQPFDLSRW